MVVCIPKLDFTGFGPAISLFRDKILVLPRYREAHGSPDTFGQLEVLRTSPKMQGEKGASWC